MPHAVKGNEQRDKGIKWASVRMKCLCLGIDTEAKVMNTEAKRIRSASASRLRSMTGMRSASEGKGWEAKGIYSVSIGMESASEGKRSEGKGILSECKGKDAEGASRLRSMTGMKSVSASPFDKLRASSLNVTHWFIEG